MGGARKWYKKRERRKSLGICRKEKIRGGGRARRGKKKEVEMRVVGYN